MTSSLGSMASSCLQQREAYPYMFHDPLHTLSAAAGPYGSHPRSACNPTAAHQQPPAGAVGQHPTYVSGSTTASTGKFNNKKIIDFFLFSMSNFSGVITAGISVPVQIPNHTSDLSSNYWPRLQ
jgi:paired box protein 6